MTIKKINLSALNKKISQTENVTEINNSSLFEDNNQISTKETQEVSSQELQIPKKKISLKDLKKYSSLITENFSQDTEKEEKNEAPQEIIAAKIEEKQEVEKMENEVVELKDKTNLESGIKTTQIEISDWDTKCNIIKEEKSELFINYKWSFSEEIKLPEEKSVKDVEIKEKNDKKSNNIKIEEETKQNEVNQTPKTLEKTNLERYSESGKIVKKNKYKKVFISSLVTMFCFLIWLWAYFLNWKTNIKWNLQENTDLTLINEHTDWTIEVQEYNNITQEEIKQIEDKVFIENKNSLEIKNNIIKENVKNQFDNISNSNTINEKLKNYLIQKYKLK